MTPQPPHLIIACHLAWLLPTTTQDSLHLPIAPHLFILLWIYIPHGDTTSCVPLSSLPLGRPVTWVTALYRSGGTSVAGVSI